MNTFDTQVLIVGAGPTGLTASILLSQLGISNIVLERHPTLHTSPQAHIINSRTLEIFRMMKINKADLDAVATPREAIQYMSWAESLAGYEYGKLLVFEEEFVNSYFASTPTPTTSIPQNLLEGVLYNHLIQHHNGDVRFQHQWDKSIQHVNGVISEISDLATGQSYTIHSQYVIAADGASSRIRQSLGIAMQGVDNIANFISMHFEADLRHLHQRTPSMLYWIVNADNPGVFIMHDPAKTWVFMTRFDPALESPDSYTLERCEEVLRQAIGEDVPFEMKRVGHWIMTFQTAEHYRKGRIFLAGDAAHRFPPTGGLGLNTGVQDVHNLAWKLSAVLQGCAGDALLETYEIERRPIAQQNGQRSYENNEKLNLVLAALGLDPEKAAMLPRVMNSPLVRHLPAGAQATVMNQLKAPVKRKMMDIRADTRAAALQREQVQHAINQQTGQFKNMGLELGMLYQHGALIRDDQPIQLPDDTYEQYIPSTQPGARLPHIWLNQSGEFISTLDLLGYDRFTLLVKGDPQPWVDASAGSPLPIQCIEISPYSSIKDLSGGWEALTAASEAVLVRPDGHVAWRTQEIASAVQLHQVMQTLLAPQS